MSQHDAIVWPPPTRQQQHAAIVYPPPRIQHPETFASGRDGLVPDPVVETGAKFLRDDGVWASAT